MSKTNTRYSNARLHLKTCAYLILLLGLPVSGGAQAQPPDALFPRLAEAQAQLDAEGWLLRGQSTFVQNFYPAFRAPYRGANSLDQGPRGRNTFSADVVLGRRLWPGAEVVFNPIVTRGHGLSGTKGFAAFPNGEAFRVGTDGPMATVARLFMRQTIGLSSDMAAPDDDPLRFRAPLPRERITLTIGKFSIFDIFDDNWTCPVLTDTPDRLNGLRGVDGGEQQTAPVVSRGVQARGGGRSPRWPLGFDGGS